MLEVLQSKKEEVAELCRRFHVRRLELFGSAATGTDRRGESDLDLLVEFAEIPSAEYADTYFGFREAMERLCGRGVDLVVASAIRNPYFRESVEQSKTLLYAA